MSFDDFDGWDPMKEDFLDSQRIGSSKTRNMNDKKFAQHYENEFDEANLYVKKVPKDINEGTFLKYFSRCGKVLRTYINRSSTRDTTYGFVNYSSPEAAQRAMTELHGAPPFNFLLSYAKKKMPKVNSSPKEEVLKVTASNRGRDVCYNTINSPVSPVQNPSTVKSTNGPSEYEVLDNNNTTNEHNSPQTGVSHNFDSSGNSDSVSSLPSRSPSQNSRYSSSSHHTLQAASHNKVVSAEHAEIDFSSMPFLSTYHALCFACDAKAGLCCSACIMPYCSPECQREDWLHHKSKCSILAPYLDRKKYQEDINTPTKTPKESSPHMNTSVKLNEVTSPHVSAVDSAGGINSYIKPDKSLYSMYYSEHMEDDSCVVDDVKKTGRTSYGGACSNEVEETTDACRDLGKKTDEVKPNPEEVIHPHVKAPKKNNNFKRKDEADNEDSNASKKSQNFGHPAAKPNQTGAFHGKEKNRKKNEDSSYKGKKPFHTDVKLKTPPRKYLMEGKQSAQQCESRNNPDGSCVPIDPKASHPASVDLSVSRNEEVDLSFAISPEQFWIQKASNRKTLQEIATELGSFAENKTLLLSPTVGSICAAYYSVDNALYRGQITEVKNDQCSVYYIDYGNTETVQANNLYNLSEKLMAYPSQAVCCKLGGVKPPGSSVKWNDTGISAFTKTFGMYSVWEARVIKSDGDMHEIDLLSGGNSLAELLVQNGNAEFIEEELSSPQSRAAPRCAVATANNGNESFLKVPTIFTHLKSGSALNILQVHHVNGDGFFVHVTNSTDFEQFAEMQNSFPKLATNLRDISSSVQKDTFALAHSPAFNTWNRCYVLSKNGQNCRVRFIDFGNEEEVSTLRELDLSHLSIPSSLLYCDISHLSSKEKDSLKECMRREGVYSGIVKEQEDGLMLDMSQTASCSVKLFPWWHGLSSNSMRRSGSLKTDEVALSTTGRTAVKVVWVDTVNNKMYVQKVSLEAKIESLEKELNDYCSSENHAVSPSVGDMVCSLFVDKKWYRSHVKKILPQGRCSVFFVDYGNEEDVKYADIRKLPERFSTPSSFCTCVSLCDLQSLTAEISGIVFEGVWELEVVNPSLKPVGVKLFRGEKDLISILISQKLIPPQASPSTVSKPSSTSLRNSIKSPHKMKFIIKDIKELELSPVKVVFVDSKKCLNLHLKSDGSKLEKMQEHLNFVMQRNKSQVKYLPSVDDIVCAVYPEDNVWYRGTILEVTDNGQCQVLFVDYGNAATVSCKDIRPLPEEFARTPLFSLKVMLHGVPVEIMDHRVKRFLEGFYKVVIVDKSSEPIKIELFLNEKSVNQSLINYLRPTSKSPQNGTVKSPHSGTVKSPHSGTVKSPHNGTMKSPQNGAVKSPHSGTMKSPQSGAIMSPQNVKEIRRISHLKTLSLPLHVKTEVIFCYGEDIETMFVHRASDRKAVTELLESLQVHCCDEDLPEYVPSNDELVAARSADSMWYRGSVVHSSGDACNIKFIDYGNVESVPKSLIRFLPAKFCSQPVYSIFVKLVNIDPQKETLNFENPFCVKVLDYINGQYILELDNVISHSEASCSSEASLSDSDFTNVPVVEVTAGSNLDIYIYRIYSPEVIFFAPYDEKRKKEFADFLADINTYCKKLKDSYTPVVSEMVLAKHPDEGNWQRANILESSENVYVVLFVDCGDVCEIKNESIRRMNKKFLKFPQQSVPCRLGGCMITDENKDKIGEELLNKFSPPCRVQDATIATIDEEFIIHLPSFQRHLIDKGIIS